jgi:hypothetical protein
VRRGHRKYCCAGVSYPRPPEQREFGIQAGAAAPRYSPDGRWYWDGQHWRPVVAPGPAWTRPYAPASGRAAAAVAMVSLATALAAVLVVGDGLDLVSGLLAPGSGLEAAAALIVVLGFLASLVGLAGAAIAVPMWLHRCYRNLPALGATDLRWSPAWAAGGWFIPLASFVIPFLVARELWAKAAGAQAAPSPLLAVWWSTWIAANILGVASNEAARLSRFGGDVFGVLNELAILGAGAAFIPLVQRITRRQRDRYAELVRGSVEAPTP